jgi:hypothetical protein
VDQVLATTLERAPPHGTHCRTRQRTRRVGLSQTAVRRIWRAFGLAWHRTETFKLPRDPQLVEKVRDVVGLDLGPPDHGLVRCVDEKTQVQVREPTAPVLAERRARGSSSGAGTMTCATARRTSSRRSTWRPAA